MSERRSIEKFYSRNKATDIRYGDTAKAGGGLLGAHGERGL